MVPPKATALAWLLANKRGNNKILLQLRSVMQVHVMCFGSSETVNQPFVLFICHGFVAHNFWASWDCLIATRHIDPIEIALVAFGENSRSSFLLGAYTYILGNLTGKEWNNFSNRILVGHDTDHFLVHYLHSLALWEFNHIFNWRYVSCVIRRTGVILVDRRVLHWPKFNANFCLLRNLGAY